MRDALDAMARARLLAELERVAHAGLIAYACLLLIAGLAACLALAWARR